MEEITQDLKVIIGKNISEYRKALNLSQLELAEKLNYSDKAISKWERGESLPDIIILKQIADLFHITVNDLLGYKTQKKQTYISKLMHNKILTLMLSIGIVWLVSTVIFAFSSTFNIATNYSWLVFIYAIPISMLLCLIFTAMWRRRVSLIIFESLFVWTLGIAICLTFFLYTKIWILLIIAIPLQALILLWNFRKKKSI